MSWNSLPIDRILIALAVVVSVILNSGDTEQAGFLLSFADYLLPPSGDGRGPGQPAT